MASQVSDRQRIRGGGQAAVDVIPRPSESQSTPALSTIALADWPRRGVRSLRRPSDGPDHGWRRDRFACDHDRRLGRLAHDSLGDAGMPPIRGLGPAGRSGLFARCASAPAFTRLPLSGCGSPGRG